MKLEVRRQYSKQLGTYYGLYAGSELIHSEFSRSTAQAIADKVSEGAMLYEVIGEQVSNDFDRKHSYEMLNLRCTIRQYERTIKSLEQEVQSLQTRAPTRKQHPSVLNAVDLLANRHNLTNDQAKELAILLIEMSAMNFSLSSELSNYIKKNDLGKRYPTIAGIVTMQNSTDTWNYHGGFSTSMYRIICQELGLSNNGSTAQAVGFIPYRDIH